MRKKVALLGQRRRLLSHTFSSRLFLKKIGEIRAKKRSYYSYSRKKNKDEGSCIKVRLNNPRSKFEITNMAIDLTPENFRGASFSEEEMEKIMAKMQVNFFISSSQKLQHRECSQE